MIKIIFKRCVIFLFIILSSTFLLSQNNSLNESGQNNLRLHWLNRNFLEIIKHRLQKGEQNLQPALKLLLQEADTALKKGPYSVLDKKATPPSKDKHDYTSMAPYWWPDTTQPDSLPYIHRDGITNPEKNAYDKRGGALMAKNSFTLALAYYFTRDERYARHAAKLIKTWFIDDSTGMNPNFNYAQFIPGRTKGRGVGIIESRLFCKAMEGVVLIQQSKFWTVEDTRQIKSWVAEFLSWLRNSRLGKSESSRENNLGSWYDFQIAYFALFIGRDKIAKNVLCSLPERRIENQIESDGSQPHALDRTKAYNYSIFNLEALFAAASLAEELKIDIWDYPPKETPAFKRALKFLIDYIGREEEWPYQQIQGWKSAYQKLFQLLRQASIVYREPKYESKIQKLPIKDKTKSRINLLYPNLNLLSK